MLLSRPHFNNVIRLIRRSDVSTIEQLRHATFNKLKALGVKRDLSRAATYTPKGSDQVDVRSILNWIEQIQPSDKRSIWQLIEMDATLVARS